MRNINLLERPKLSERYGGRLLILSTATALALASMLVLYGNQLSERIAAAKTDLVLEENRIRVLSDEKKMDRRTERYLLLNEQIEKLAASRINWLPTVRGIIDYLPEGGRINRVAVAAVEPGSTTFPLELSVDLKDWFVLKTYVSMLRSHPLVKDLQLSGIDRQRMTDPGAAARELEKQRSAIERVPVTILPPVDNQSADPFIQSLNQFLAPGAVDPLAESDPEAETTGPFSPEELNVAAKVLEDLNRSTSESVTTENEVPEETVLEAEPDQVEFLRCQLRIVISLKPENGR